MLKNKNSRGRHTATSSAKEQEDVGRQRRKAAQAVPAGVKNVDEITIDKKTHNNGGEADENLRTNKYVEYIKSMY